MLHIPRSVADHIRAETKQPRVGGCRAPEPCAMLCAVSRVAIWRYAPFGAKRVLDPASISNENARRHKPSGRIPGAELLRPSVAWSCQVAPRSAARAALPRQRGAPDGGNHTPKTERPQDFLRSPAISRSIAFGLLCCGLLIQGACIVANLPPGATMPQEAHGAVGGHGCRRREPDPTLRHRKVRSPTIAAAGSPPAKW